MVRIMFGQSGMGKRAVDVRDELGKTPLFEACEKGKLGSANVMRNPKHSITNNHQTPNFETLNTTLNTNFELSVLNTQRSTLNNKP
jgi:hypothetical protein